MFELKLWIVHIVEIDCNIDIERLNKVELVDIFALIRSLAALYISLEIIKDPTQKRYDSFV